MDKVILSEDNVKVILQALSSELKKIIASKDLSAPYTEQFEKLGLLKTDGDGNSYLTSKGEYVLVNADTISATKEKIQNIFDVFDIKDEDGHLTYSIDVPEDITSKTDILTINGDGSKVLCDDGVYRTTEVQINEMSEDEVNEIINGL